MQNEKLFWSDEMYQILGYDPDESEASYQAYFNRIHPEDQERVEQEYIESSKKIILLKLLIVFNSQMARSSISK